MMAPPREKLPRVPFHRDPRLRGIALQALLCVAIGLLVYGAVHNAVENLQRAKVASGFGFWNETAGFDISQTLVDYSSQTSTFGRALVVGLLNTLLVAAIGIIFATIIGFTVGIARLSKNFLVQRLAIAYVEAIRNVPLLLQLLFWYNAVLKALPELAASVVMPGGFILNNRGLFAPRPLFANGWQIIGVLTAAVVLALVFYVVTGRVERLQRAVAARAAGAVLILAAVPALAFATTGATFAFEYPEIGRFNVRGGAELLPELVALLLGLSIYTAAFIAEAVRAGLQSVPRGQTEAAQALGLGRMQTMRLIIIPQAMRVIIPPLTNQYLNLAKNSSLAVAIGYPDLMQVAGSVLNISGQAVEVVAITMAVYLTLSLVTALVMNVYNARYAVVER
jgi:general L-amino acid transport system permease protein